MVREMDQEQESYRSRLFHFKGMNENVTNRHTKSLSVESASKLQGDEELKDDVKIQASSKNPNEQTTKEQIGSKFCKSRLGKDDDDSAMAAFQAREKQLLADIDQMKERFSKLLLGEDMSGGGKGVSSALALSNAITNLAAAVFGEQHRLEPMSAERKVRWKREIDVLLCVTDHIVEFVASQQKNKDGSNMDIMVTRQRNDLHMNVPALRKLDAMLISCLDNFKDQTEFCYMSKDAPDSEKGGAKRKDDKWWLPTPKVPANGLSDAARKFLQYQKDCVNQVLKAAMAINAQVLSEMEIPENYIESLPKNGRASLGDSIYKSITVEFFDPDQFLSTMDMSSEHKISDLQNKIEASIVIWRRKMNHKDGKSAWGSGISFEKRELFEERAETILLIIKHRFPGIPQSSLDVSKIQYNNDVGQAVLESYSRVLETLAFTVLSRIEDVRNADSATQGNSQTSKRISLQQDSSDNNSSSDAMTLSDFMGWDIDQGNAEVKKDHSEDVVKEVDKHKFMNIVINKRSSYLDNLGATRSPTARH